MAHFIVRRERTPVSTLVLRVVLAVELLGFWMVAVLDSGSISEAQLVTIPVAAVISYVLLGTPEIRNALNSLPPRVAKWFCEISLLVMDSVLLWANYVMIGEWIVDLTVLVIVALATAVGQRSRRSYRAKARWFAAVGTVGCLLNVALTIWDPIDATVKVAFLVILAGMLGANLLSAYALASHLTPGSDLVVHVAERHSKVRAEQQWEASLAARRDRMRRNIAKRRALRRTLGL